MLLSWQIHELQELKVIAAQFPPELRDRVAELFTGRAACPTMPHLRLTEIAALNGDKALYEWLISRGADPALPNKWCATGQFSVPFTAAKLIQGL